MKVSKSVIATVLIVALPLSALAGDKDKMHPMSGANAAADFKSLDTNGDGKISRNEAARDSKIEFASVDKNSDGFIDSTEFAHREMSNDSGMQNPSNTPNDPAQPRK